MRKSILGAAVLLALVTGFAHPAHAATLATATGTVTSLSDTLTTMGTVGGASFISEVNPGISHGGLVGTIMDTDTYMQQHDGSYVGQGTEVCASCSIGGRTGTYTAIYSFSGSGNNYTGTLLFTHASGGLAGLHGGGTFLENGGTPETYIYTYWFTKKA